MKVVYQQITAHPHYPHIKSSTRWAFEMGCVGGGSHCTKANNAWSREIWRSLYHDQPMKDGTRLLQQQEGGEGV